MKPNPFSMLRQLVAWTVIATSPTAAPVCWGQEKDQPPRKQPQPGSLPQPTHANAAYGTHERHVLDLWLARSEQPTPLAVFIHGGAFIGGDKSQLSPGTLKELLDAGISVAAVGLGQEAIEKDVVVEHLEPRRGKLLGEEVLAAAGLW